VDAGKQLVVTIANGRSRDFTTSTNYMLTS